MKHNIEKDFHESISDLRGLFTEESYQNIPDDWVLVISDIKDSTGHILKGRQAEVNRVGISVFEVAKNEMHEKNYPTYFGGDGCTLLMPMKSALSYRTDFANCVSGALSRYSIELRVAFVPVKILKQNGYKVQCCRFMNPDGSMIFAITGSGIEYVEQLMKKENLHKKFLIQPNSEIVAESDALNQENRNHISIEQEIVSIIIKAKGTLAQRNETYNTVITQIAGICGKSAICREYRDMHNHCPFSEKVSVTDNSQPLRGRISKYFKYLKKLNMEFSLDRFKFDGVLKQTIQAGEESYLCLKAILEGMRMQGKLNYGLAFSEKTLIHYQEMDNGYRYYFVDGLGRGYAHAASMLKQQMNSEDSAVKNEKVFQNQSVNLPETAHA